MNIKYPDTYFLLERPRLHTLLETQNPVITVVGGAGCGKTLAVKSYLDHSRQHYALFSLTSLDNHQQHFWKTFCQIWANGDAAVEKEIMKGGFPCDGNLLLHTIEVLKMSLYRRKFTVLIFDNCHYIKNKAICHFIEYLVSAGMKNLSFIFLSRTPAIFHILYKYFPNIHMITTQDLAFTEHELRQFLQDQDLFLIDSVYQALLSYTRGWPLSVNLAVRVIKNNPDIKRSELIKNFQKNIYDLFETYLSSKYTSDDLRKISLLAALEFFPLSLAGKLLRSRQLMERAMSDFLICTDQHHGIYQLHGLFKTYLSHQYTEPECKQLQEVHTIAGKWFYENEYPIAALNCFHSIRNYPKCLKIIARMLPQRLSEETGRLIIDIIESFPEDFKQDNPHVPVLHAVLHLSYLEYTRAEHLLREMIQKYEDHCRTPAEHSALCDAYLTIALLYMLLGNTRYQHYLKQAARCNTSGSLIFERGFLLLYNGNSITLNKGASGELEDWVDTLGKCEHLLISLMHCGYGFYHLSRAEAAYLLGNLDDAKLYAQLALNQGRQYKQTDIVCTCYNLLTKITLAQGDYTGCLRAIADMWIYVESVLLPGSFRLPDLTQSWFFTKLQLPEKIPGWDMGRAVLKQNVILINVGAERTLYAECLITAGKYKEALNEITAAQKLFKRRKLLLSQISLYTMSAVVYARMQNFQNCEDSFVQVYEMTYPNDIILPIIEYGENCCYTAEFLLKGGCTKIPANWLHMIARKAAIYRKNLSQVRFQYLLNQEGHQSIPVLDDLETNILIQLSLGTPIREIAQILHQTQPFIRARLKSIYGKLEAVNAAHAVRIAHSKKIL